MNNPATKQSISELLKGHQFINLTTFRKSGVGVTTPVWFVLVDGKIYGTTQLQAGKVKRMRNNPRVTFGPCTYNGKSLGETAGGSARILTPEEGMLADNALRKKYRLQYAVLTGMAKLRGARSVFWEVTPD